MRKEFNRFLKVVQKNIEPLVKKLEPVYLKFKPYQDKATSWFFSKMKRFLAVSNAQKTKIISGNLVANSRMAVLIAIVFQVLISAYVVQSFTFVLASLIFYLPVAYLVSRGYRIASLLLIIIRTFDSVMLLMVGNISVVNILLWWVIFCAIYFNDFRIENARIQLEKAEKLRAPKNTTFRDVIIAVLLFVVLVFSTIVVKVAARDDMLQAIGQDNIKLGMVSTFVVYNEYGYSDYCAKQGYILQNYPQAFNDKFAVEIKNIQKKLSKQGMSLKKVYDQIKQNHWAQLEPVIAGSLEVIRRNAAVLQAAQEQKIAPEEVKWNSDVSDLVSAKQACEIFDANADGILAQPNPQYAIIEEYK